MPFMNRFNFQTLVVPIWLTVLVIGCAHQNPYYDPKQSHHRPNGFVNSDGTTVSKSFHDLIRWYRERFGKSLPPPPGQFISSYEAFPVHLFNAKVDLNNLSQTATWLGHATTLVRSNGFPLLTDPHFSERAFPVQWIGPQRKVKSPVSVANLPPIDVVVISHNHYDHMDRDSLIELAQLQPQILFLVPLGVEKTFLRWGITQVKALDWWQTLKLPDHSTELIFVPAYHWSARSFFDRNESLWGGWVLKQPNFSFYFSGDTGYNTQDFTQIGSKYGPFDLSAIAVGAYEPRWFMKAQHINPDEALQIHLDVQSKRSIGVHWGTFELTDEPLDQPIDDLQHALIQRQIPKNQFMLLKQGETISLSP